MSPMYSPTEFRGFFLTGFIWAFFLDKHGPVAILFERYAVRTIVVLGSLAYSKKF
jgi:hypothetical protein